MACLLLKPEQRENRDSNKSKVKRHMCGFVFGLFIYLSRGYYILLVAVGNKQTKVHFFFFLMKGSMNGAGL